MFKEEKSLFKAIKKETIKIGYKKFKINLPVGKLRQQCRKCGIWGHSEKECNKPSFRCLKFKIIIIYIKKRCSGNHKTESCKNTEKKCINCKGSHNSWSKKCHKPRILREAARDTRRRALFEKFEEKTTKMHRSKERNIEDDIDKIYRNEMKRARLRIKERLDKKLSKLRVEYFLFSFENYYSKLLIFTFSINKYNYNQKT